MVALVALIALIAGCAQVPPQVAANEATRPAGIHPADADVPAMDAVTQPAPDSNATGRLARTSAQSGVASWYAARFQGRRTASGERYDARALTAAHRALPLGTYARVTSVATSRSVIVRINDRGPFVKGRIIDLSYAAANALGLTRASSMRVVVEAVHGANARTPDQGRNS